MAEQLWEYQIRPKHDWASAKRLIGFNLRMQALYPPRRPACEPPAKKYRSMTEIMERALYAVVESEDYPCDKGFHMECVRPIVVRVPIG